MIELKETNENKAVLAGVCFGEEREFGASMRELAGLAEACGYLAADQVTQNLARADNAFFVGSGKVQEIREALYASGADTVIFLNALSPAQLSNLAKELEAEVLDKTGLILRIFGERARTAEARMQVEYAKLQYALPRLSGLRQNLSRQGGTGGSMSNKGSGEKQIELDRRHIEKRMAELRRGLAAVESGRETMRRKRQNSGLPLVSLVGYTNAGKSTLLNRMLDRWNGDEAHPEAHKRVLEKDMLFATLDTTVRKISPGGGKEFLLSDTVGFIRDLPHDLIRAFRSTLEEARLSDLLLQVVDCSDPDWQRHVEVTEETLRELGAGELPMIYVMNKADRCTAESHPDGETPGALPRISGERRIYLSAANGVGIDELTSLIVKRLYGDRTEETFLFPYSEGAAENRIREQAELLETEYREDGIYLRCRLSKRLLEEFAGYRVPKV